MKAFILAAGLGTRLKSLTDKTPKPMLPVGGMPLLEHQLRLLKKYGVKECIINLYYFPEQIKNYFGSGEKIGLKITYITEKTLSGTAGPIQKKSSFFNEPFIVMYGDNLTDINLEKLKIYHYKKGGLVTIALYHEKHPETKGVVITDKNDKVLSFKEKPKKEEITTHWANAGIYICEPEILKYIPKKKFFDFGYDLFPLLLQKNKPMFGYKMKETLLDIGTPETYALAQEKIEKMNL